MKDPARDPLPEDSLLAAQIRLGFQIVRNTRQHARDFVANDLFCGNCHLNAGQLLRALPFTGIAATFPEPRRREGRLFSLEDRIRGWFLRSMNGEGPGRGDRRREGRATLGCPLLNDGAGAARVYTLAGYIRYAMPLTQPGVLSDEEAQHVAAFINAHERPSYTGKAEDFPAGAPIDAVYYPRYPVNPLRARLQGTSTTGG